MSLIAIIDCLCDIEYCCRLYELQREAAAAAYSGQQSTEDMDNVYLTT